jgi:hypothetical protein
MKKIIALTASILFVATSALAYNTQVTAGTNFANAGQSVYGAKGGASGTTTPLIGKTSAGVGIQMNTSATGYAAETQHKNGTKAFGSAYDSTAIFVKDVSSAVGTMDTAVGAVTGSDNFTSANSWTSM